MRQEGGPLDGKDAQARGGQGAERVGRQRKQAKQFQAKLGGEVEDAPVLEVAAGNVGNLGKRQKVGVPKGGRSKTTQSDRQPTMPTRKQNLSIPLPMTQS